MSIWADGESKKLWNVLGSQKKHTWKYELPWQSRVDCISTVDKNSHKTYMSTSKPGIGHCDICSWTLCFKAKISVLFLFPIWVPKQFGLLKVSASCLAYKWAAFRSLQFNHFFFFNFSASTLKPKIVTDTVVIEKTFLKDLVEGSFFCDYSYAFIR